ncbi:protein disulfide-isomerase [Geosmithia morbida]|uniref:Protein disulfide-isomerase n=1 Tax=Geosmithia morbida TaxID=1094350 RepID=A0A9P5D3Z5_9HYPO|nr:protein disulfide-isomerase [Geosmithia morbida]KAF4126768.1 protein disulfide-isomerase [Geosmithia morbida]
MRLLPFTFLAGAAALVGAKSAEKDDASEKSTVFNGVSVPPLMELSPATFPTELKKHKYLVVKHYSPYCPHCIDFIPTYQTLYEYYYTSHPEDMPDASFSEYYDVGFAAINCIAHGDLCDDHGVRTWPTTILYEDGEPIDLVHGAKSIETIGSLIEPVLEKRHPGSRPKSVEYPKPGATEFPAGASSKMSTYDESAADADEKSSSKESEEKLAVDELPAKKSSQENLGKSDKASPDKGTKQSIDNSAARKSTDKDAAEDSSEKSTDKSTDKSSDKPLEKPSKGTTGKSSKENLKSFGKDWKSPTAAEVHNSKQPKKPTVTPNTNGVSISLTAESFQRMVTMSQDPWFIKFYAPWCPHCQAMGPTWDQLAKTMRGKLNVGEVNCDKEGRLCKDVSARAYPTILFFKGGERSEYNGLRGLGDFVQYADNALDLASGVPDVTAEEFEALEEKEDVIFIYFYDHATTSEDFMALERLPLSLIGHAKLVKTNDRALYDRFKISTWPRLMVSREGRPTYYTPLTPNAMRDVHAVLNWMRSVWLPLVPELTASNANQIMDGKYVVLGILNRGEEESFETSLREMKSAANEWMDRQIQEFQLERKKLRDAKQMRIEEAQDRDDERALRQAKTIRIDMDGTGHKEVLFAWADGIFWQRWIRTTYGIDVKDGERVIINDHDTRQYWDQTATGNYIMVSRTAISETLDKIVYGPNTIKPKLTTTLVQKFFLDLGVTFSEHPYLSTASVVGLIIGAYSWYRNRRRNRGGYFNLDDPIGNPKDGLLGQNGSTKAD